MNERLQKRMERCLRKFARAKKKEFYHKMNKTAKQYKKDRGEIHFESEVSSTMGKAKLSLAAYGQRVWTFEYGKGKGTGTFEKTNYTLPTSFHKTKIFRQYTGNPARNPMRKAYQLYANRPSKRKNKITVRRKRGGVVQEYEMSYPKLISTPIKSNRVMDKNGLMRLMTKEEQLAESNIGWKQQIIGKFTIYSRPGTYTDLDGKQHTSDAKAVFDLEKPNKHGVLKRPKLSHPGRAYVTNLFEYDFVREKPRIFPDRSKAPDWTLHGFCKQANEEIKEYAENVFEELGFK